MKLKRQKMGMGIETIIVMANAVVECEGQSLGGMSGSLVPHCQKNVETLSDQQYANAMEERYGIREEGVF
ncbi:MAG: hypothetical protein FJ122_18065 [Deltaproteobacteria bacterium]|nr:hypothetical protein [Deltaproteobacteria bacterium]